MEEEIQDVNTIEPSAIDESSNEVQEVAQSEEQEVVETPQVEEPAPEVSKPPVEEVDEMGVPYKNRYMEAQRKLQKLEEEKSQPKQQQPEEQKYTAEQLRAFAISTDDPQNRAWALNELDKISRSESVKIVRDELTNLQKQQMDVATRQQTFASVVQRNPDIAVKDPTGKIIGFNTQSPLYNRMNFYMQNPDVANRPDALYVAERFAKADLADGQTPVIQQTIAKQNSQIKNLQKKTMVEGGGNNSQVQVSARQAALDKAKQTGNIHDASNAMGALLRDAGLMSD